mmetsp:Transcript_42995/g.77243  ORF Transcript_42995/g.77243 Transcript_42995/m.77243 type:complete len:317 (-) Transcript_42995:224-1174(-)
MEQRNKRRVNKELEATQKRAEQVAQKAVEASLDDPDVYDYDKFFEEKEKKVQQTAMAKKEKVKDAKYMSNMLKSSADRKLEMDIWRTQKMKKESEEIAAQLEGDVPEEKFVTRAWKEKLDEIYNFKQQQAAQDAADEKAQISKKNFGRSLMNFRANLLSKQEEDEVKAEKEAEQDDYYNSLNLGIKKEVKKEIKQELKEEELLQKQQEAIQKALEAEMKAAKLEPAGNPPSETADESTAAAADATEVEPEVVKRFAPSAALLRRQEREREPLEVKLERRQKRWASSFDDEAIADARSRFLQRRADRNQYLQSLRGR